MSFPNKEVRQKCWDSRDRYWECLDANKEVAEQCVKLRQQYEALCPPQWVQHFDRKRDYLKFKDRIEKEGYEPLNPTLGVAITLPVRTQQASLLPEVASRHRVYRQLM